MQPSIIIIIIIIIGDIILLDGSVLKDDMALTGKVMKMVVGKITGKINKTTVAVLKD